MNDNNKKQRLQQISSKKNYNLARIPKVFNEMLCFMDSNIRKQFRSFSLLALCGTSDKAKFIIDSNLQRAFSKMTIRQRLDIYQKAVNYADYILNCNLDREDIERQISVELKNILQLNKKDIYITIHQGFKSSQQIKIQIEGFKILTKKAFNIDLQNYLIRKSKKKNIQSQCYVFQAINSSQPQIIRFSFANITEQQQSINKINKIVEIGFKNTIKNILISSNIVQSPNKYVSSNNKYKPSSNNNNNVSSSKKIVQSNNKIVQQKKQISDLKYSDRSYGQLRQTQRQVLQSPIHISKTQQYQSSSKILQYSRLLAENKRNQNNYASNQALLQQLLRYKNGIKHTRDKSLYDDISKQINNITNHSNKNYKLDRDREIVNIFNQVLHSQHYIKQQFIKDNQKTNNTNKNNFKSKNTGFYYKNIFEQIFPSYSLREIQNSRNFNRQIWKSESLQMSIYEHSLIRERYKVRLIVNNSKLDDVYRLLINAEHTKKWNRQVDQSQIKITLSTDNCLICYQKHKRINNWFKQRDYLYLRHAFTYRNCKYICDKSIEHSTFIPFQSLQRANIQHFITKIKQVSNNIRGKQVSDKRKQKSVNNQIQISLDVIMRQEGYLGQQKRRFLTIQYLKGYENIERYLQNNRSQQNYCNLDWNIDWIEKGQDNRSNESMMNINKQLDYNISSNQFNYIGQFDEPSQIQYDQVNIENNQSNDSEQFYSVVEYHNDQQDQNQNKNNQLQKQNQIFNNNQRRQVSQQQININNTNNIKSNNNLTTNNTIIKYSILLDNQGYCILPDKYIKHKHIKSPSKLALKQIPIKIYENILCKQDFIYDQEGGMKLINKKKIQQQDNVLSYIMKTMKKNLFTGKSILSISLPVQIFREDSNTQRLCDSMSLAPLFLQKAANSADPIQRMKWAIAFGLSNSILYFYIEKSFNPILGQTYQGTINGCPVYAQQISHHPPISSIYLIGRGYKVYANIQSRVALHLNSGDGINKGYYSIQFDDYSKIKFQTAPGEISGFTIGDRKFRYKDRMYVIDEYNCLYAELLFQQPNLGIFSKKSWIYGDQLGGSICRVTRSFISKFLESEQKIHPKQKDIQKLCSSIDGRWIYYLNFDGKKYYDIDNDLPYKMIDYEFPLQSDARFREDLIYRTRNDLVKSQIHKQYLENKQRKDRKQRQNYHKTH